VIFGDVGLRDKAAQPNLHSEQLSVVKDVMRIVVLGVGNILLTDEGVGVYAVEKLQQDYALPPEITVIDGGTCGMEMLEDLAGADHLLIVDAVRSGQPPATIVRIADEDVPVFFKTKLSPHQIGLSDVLATLVLTDEAPGTTTVIGIEPVSLDTHLGLSPEVAAQLPRVVEILVSELQALELTVEKKGA
jgi:hydrogenase maturation protease